MKTIGREYAQAIDKAIVRYRAEETIIRQKLLETFAANFIILMAAIMQSEPQSFDKGIIIRAGWSKDPDSQPSFMTFHYPVGMEMEVTGYDAIDILKSKGELFMEAMGYDPDFGEIIMTKFHIPAPFGQWDQITDMQTWDD